MKIKNFLLPFYLISFGICFFSYLAWFKNPFNIGRVEFDVFHGFYDAKLLGNFAHYIAFVALAFFYFKIVQAKEQIEWKAVAIIWAIYICAVPWISVDVTFYLAKGWLASHYGLNPYLHTITDAPRFESDPIFQSIAPSLFLLKGNYGPIFQLLSYCVSVLSFGSPKIGVLLFKIISAVSLVACYYLINKIAMISNCDRSKFRKLFMVNPLILFTFLTAAHNDTLLMMLVLASYYLLLNNRLAFSGWIMGISITFKLIGLFFLPVIVLYFYLKCPLRTAMLSISRFFIFLLMALILSVLIDVNSLDYYREVVGYTVGGYRTSIYSIISVMGHLFPLPHIMSALTFGKLMFVTTSCWLLFRNLVSYRERSTQFLLDCSFEIIILMQYLVLPSMNEWYLLWSLSLALLVRNCSARRYIYKVTAIFMPLVIFTLLNRVAAILISQFSIAILMGIATFRYFAEKYCTKSANESVTQAV